MSSTRRIVFLLGGLGLLALFVAGVWVQKSSFRNPPSVELNVGYIPITDCAQLYVAQHEGLFEKHGLKVTLVPMAGGATILQSLSSGALDVAFSNLASVVFYERNAGPLHRLGGGTLMNAQFSEAGLVVREESGIEDLAGLRGKTIAVNTLRNIVDLAVVRALRLHGVSSSEFTLVEVPFKDMEVALQGGQVDAATLPEPILSRAVTAGGLKNLGDHFVLAVGEMYSTGYFALPSRLPVLSDDLDRFNAAIYEATPIADAYGPEAIKAIAAVTKIPEEDLRQAGRPKFVENVPDTALEQMRGWLREEGFLDR